MEENIPTENQNTEKENGTPLQEQATTSTDSVVSQFRGMPVNKQYILIDAVSPGTRFVHYLIDFSLICLLTIPFVFMFSLLGVTDDLFLWVSLYSSKLSYYFIMETFFQRTVGKYSTGSIVIDTEGNNPNSSTIFLRTIIRFVPFEYLSCFVNPSRGWHDKWSDTLVVSIKDLEAATNANSTVENS